MKRGKDLKKRLFAKEKESAQEEEEVIGSIGES